MDAIIDGETAAETSAWGPACHIARPTRLVAPVVFASPHSGRAYPKPFLATSRLTEAALRSSEDAYVDELFACAPEHGAPLIRALFPRAFVDVNRDAREIDPTMFRNAPRGFRARRSARLSAGLGCIPRVVNGGQEIHAHALDWADAERRLAHCYAPYHAALDGLMNETFDLFGAALLIDCHSMPSGAAEDAVDVVLGDRHGAGCRSEVTSHVEDLLRREGLRVARNAPYAGGYACERHGRPHDGRHALQIEIKRALYMNERAVAPHDGFQALQTRIQRIIASLCAEISSPLLQR